jgi:CRP/FNR family transcriptional regulator, cyclic AMP receptor protein
MMTDSARPHQGFWGYLAAPEREALEAVATRSIFPAGWTIMDRQGPSDDVVILLSGFGKVMTRVSTGPHVVLAVRGPGDIIGETVGTVGGERTTSVAAIDFVEALRIYRVAFAAVLAEHPHAADALQRSLINKLREADDDRLAAGYMTVGQRLARFLLRLAHRHGAPVSSGGTTIGVGLSQRDLAACVGGSARAVARELEDWRQRKFIQTGRRSIIIMRPDDLKRIAGPAAPP